MLSPPRYHAPRVHLADNSPPCAEIYRIVSSKALDSGDGAQANISAGTSLSLSKPADENADKGGKCC